jgi:hypothetical protein
VAKTQSRIHLYAMVLLTLNFMGHGIAQNSSETSQKTTTTSINSLWPSWPKARPEDVQSAQSTIKTYFEILSGSASTERDWDRFKSLFLPDGRFIGVKTWNNDPHLIPDTMDVQKLVERLKSNLRKADSEESPVDIQVKEVSHLVQVFVTSEVHVHTLTNGDLSARYLSSFELVKDADRYWIVEVLNDIPGK